MQTLGPGTTSGYVFGYDKSSGDIFISKVLNDTLQGPLSASAPVTLLFGAIGYNFTFQGTGANLTGAIYQWGSASPMASVSVTDTAFASGQVGLVVFSQTATGLADATFRDFTETPEPAVTVLLALGAWMICGGRRWAVSKPRSRGTEPAQV